MKAGHHAAPGIERRDGVDAAHETNVQVQAVRAGLLAQRRQRRVVAGIQRQDVGIVVKGTRKCALDVAAQCLDLRRQPGLRLAFSPEQLFAEFRQARALAFVPDDQGAPQRLLPRLERAPNMAVGQIERARGFGYGAVLAHRMQHVHQRVAYQRVLAALGRQQIRKFDFMHGVFLFSAAYFLMQNNA